ncbi:calcineurin-like phosphoesterase C-terminal domain-containing protein [Chitinophaga alhagiae]|uniref:calcineurin-like phosphoesterase C-terminal domain-containing protein n=1 Tax=Chitinophaga alhagiae TaxID=2203219 RepID=UPI000E5BDD1C|nr:calcineurin-like phosphoesterase family protein [Chitinophaga alhagiae]
MNRFSKTARLTAFFLLTGAALSFAQQTATGFVFHDANGNGKKDRKEAGIANVSVSNGVDVVATDARGRYQLPVGNDNILFVIKPSGYKVPVNELQQPQYYYIHKPAGSPALKYKGVAPTGKLPSSVDFPLTPSEESGNFTALVFGDPQPYTLDEIGYFSEGIVAEVRGIANIAFGLSLGDLVGDNLDLHNPYIKAVKEVGLPWYNLMGNHDMNYDAVADSLSDESFEASFGPANYAYNYGNAHFIVLDDILYPDPRDGKGYWGGFRKSQLDFIENDLKQVPKDKLIVLAFHIPLMHHEENAFRNADRQRLFDILKDYPHTLSLSAHTHLQRQNFYGKADGWRQEKPHHEYNAGTTSGDWYSGGITGKGVPDGTMRDGTPRGYAFLNISNNQYTIDYKVAGAPKEYQIKLFHPKVVNQQRGTAAGIFANFFMGDKSSKVAYKVGNGNWKKMTYVEEADPAYALELFKWDTAEELLPGRRPSNPENCTHLWRGAVPKGLPAGEHVIEVRATDMFGRTFTQTGKIRYELPK